MTVEQLVRRLAKTKIDAGNTSTTRELVYALGFNDAIDRAIGELSQGHVALGLRELRDAPVAVSFTDERQD